MKGWLLLQGNAWSHIVHVMMEALANIGRTPVEHPSCSPYLILWDCAFQTFKRELWGQKFSTDTVVKQATAATLCKMSGNCLLHVFWEWVGHCKKHRFKKETVLKAQGCWGSEYLESSHYFSNSPCIYKYYVFGHYPSSCPYLKTVLFIFQNTTFGRLDCVLKNKEDSF
jgi:hypothetical protein